MLVEFLNQNITIIQNKVIGDYCLILIHRLILAMYGSLIQIKMDALIVLIFLLDLLVWLINNGFRSIRLIRILWFILKLKVLFPKLTESIDDAVEMFVLLFKHLYLIGELVQF